MGRLLAGVVVLGLASAAAHADQAIRANGTVNVRSGPGTGYGIIGQVPSNHVYVAFASSGAWRKIWFDGGTGWTHGGYYSALSGASAARVTTDTLNVRTGPGTGYAIKGQAHLNQKYYRYAQSGGWSHIYFDGASGWCSNAYLAQVSLSGGSSSPPPAPSGTTNLSMQHYYQSTNYWCGPTTAQMIIKEISGNYVGQGTLASYCGTTSSSGTSNYMVKQAVNHYAPSSYQQLSYSGSRLRSNISAGKPCNVNMKGMYLAYWNYANVRHHSPAKGFTSGGFYIHDSYKGPNKWASNTQLHNAVVYHYNLTACRYE